MFHLTAQSGGDPVAVMQRVAAAFVTGVPAIGVARSMSVSTHVGGEDAHEWDGVIGAAEIAQLAAHRDLTRFTMDCDLRCEDTEGHELVIRDGLTFWVQLAELDSPPTDPLEVTLALDADIYIAHSWGEDRDNRALAAINAPIFNRFLERLLRETGAVVESVSATGYKGQVDKTGIVLPG